MPTKVVTTLSVLAVAAMLVAVACRPRLTLTVIADQWFVDEGLPQKPASHLYQKVDGSLRLVDRQIEAYRLYADRCLMYEASRPAGRTVFAAWNNGTPVAIATSDGPRHWRLDADGPLRVSKRSAPDGRTLLVIELLKYGDICYLTQLQPRFHEDWDKNARVVPGRVTAEESVLDVHGTDSVGNSTLSDAAKKGQLVLVDELLGAGADVNSTNDAGISVLMTSVIFRNPDVTRRLIERGARINAQDDDGLTALMWAARYRNLEIAQILLDAGADGKIADDRGLTAAGWVPDGGRDEVRQLREQLTRAAAGAK
jgi:hypothetical protein